MKSIFFLELPAYVNGVLEERRGGGGVVACNRHGIAITMLVFLAC